MGQIEDIIEGGIEKITAKPAEVFSPILVLLDLERLSELLPSSWVEETCPTKSGLSTVMLENERRRASLTIFGENSGLVARLVIGRVPGKDERGSPQKFTSRLTIIGPQTLPDRALSPLAEKCRKAAEEFSGFPSYLNPHACLYSELVIYEVGMNGNILPREKIIDLNYSSRVGGVPKRVHFGVQYRTTPDGKWEKKEGSEEKLVSL